MHGKGGQTGVQVDETRFFLSLPSKNPHWCAHMLAAMVQSSENFYELVYKHKSTSGLNRNALEGCAGFGGGSPRGGGGVASDAFFLIPRPLCGGGVE